MTTTNGLLVRLRRTDARRVKRLVLSVGAVFSGTFLLFGTAGLRLNTSPSLPVGLYLATSDLTAPLAEFCPPEPYASLAIRRGYRTTGNCPDGATPLLKPIVAVEGDTVEVSSHGISVNGRLIPNTQPRVTDTAGRTMPVWPTGIQRVTAGSVWVASSFNSRSFDSRYFGPISVRTMRDRLRPLLTE